MLELGKKQVLRVLKRQDFGVYLSDDPKAGKEQQVLLPARQVPAGAEIGTPVEVFLYRDSSDRLIATTNTPKLELGETAVLRVKDTTRIGAFLDWGLEKDLLLPFHEQTCKVEKNEDVLVALYLDKSGRLCATMKVYHYLHTASPYSVGDVVQGRVYEQSKNFGVFVAVDDKYSALIPKKDAQGEFRPGEILKVRITQIREAPQTQEGYELVDLIVYEDGIYQRKNRLDATPRAQMEHWLSEEEKEAFRAADL